MELTAGAGVCVCVCAHERARQRKCMQASVCVCVCVTEGLHSIVEMETSYLLIDNKEKIQLHVL